MMMMTANNFDPVRYSGRWFDVASLKRGFAGQGQEDCHCTQVTSIRRLQGVYSFDMKEAAIKVDTFCVHGSPDGYIRGKVQCVGADKSETDLEKREMIKDNGFVQVIQEKTPNPGPEFIAKYKNYLVQFGYDPEKIKDTPQDCEVMSDGQLAAMMSMPGMEQTLTNQFPDLGLRKSMQFDPFTSVFETLRKLVQLYFN